MTAKKQMSASKKMILSSILVLCIISLVCGGLLATANVFLATSGITNDVKKIFPVLASDATQFAEVNIKPDDKNIINVVKVMDGSQKDGIIFRSKGVGYNGDIEMMYLVSGSADSATIQKAYIFNVDGNNFYSAAKKEVYEAYFTGKSTFDSDINKEAAAAFDVATQSTSRTGYGMVTAVKAGFDYYKSNLDEILKAATQNIDMTGITADIDPQDSPRLPDDLYNSQKTRLKELGYEFGVDIVAVEAIFRDSSIRGIYKVVKEGPSKGNLLVLGKGIDSYGTSVFALEFDATSCLNIQYVGIGHQLDGATNWSGTLTDFTELDYNALWKNKTSAEIDVSQLKNQTGLGDTATHGTLTDTPKGITDAVKNAKAWYEASGASFFA